MTSEHSTALSDQSKMTNDRSTAAVFDRLRALNDRDTGAFSTPTHHTSEEGLLQKVREEITLHRQMLSKQTYLQRAVSFVHHPGEDSLRELMIVGDELKDRKADLQDSKMKGTVRALTDSETKSIEENIGSDRQNLEKELRISASGAKAISMAPLFVPGPWGVGLSAALTAANTASPADTISEQLADGVMGATAGAISNKLGTTSVLPAGYLTRAPLLVMSQTASQTALNSHTYIDDRTGAVNLDKGLHTIAERTTDWRTMAAATGSLLLTGGVAAGLNGFTRGALNSMPILATESTAAISGFSSSVIDDAKKHFIDGQKMSPMEVATNAVENTGLSMLLAAPGGMVSHYAALAEEARSPHQR